MPRITFKSSKAVYDRILDLKISTPQIVINYGLFLKEHNYFEEEFMLFKVYDNDQNPERSKLNPLDNEPGLLFHEFIFMLALMSLNSD